MFRPGVHVNNLVLIWHPSQKMISKQLARYWTNVWIAERVPGLLVGRESTLMIA